MRFLIFIITLFFLSDLVAQTTPPPIPVQRTRNGSLPIDYHLEVPGSIKIPTGVSPSLNGSPDKAGLLFFATSDSSLYIRSYDNTGTLVWKKNRDGRDGLDGRDGVDGTDGQDGAPGSPGTPGSPGIDGRDGTNGAPGAPGISIISTTKSVTGDTLYINYSNGTTDTITGVKGDTGAGLNVIGSLNNPGELPPTGNAGSAYLIAGDLWVWSANTNSWQNAGNIQGPAGATWYSGSTVPGSGLGNIGDMYFNTATKKIYRKTGPTTWVEISDLSVSAGGGPSKEPVTNF